MVSEASDYLTHVRREKDTYMFVESEAVSGYVALQTHCEEQTHGQ
jgi:hypothetical protein